MKKLTVWMIALLAAGAAWGGDTINVTSFRHVGPFPVKTPYKMDSVNVSQKTFNEASLLDGASSVPVGRLKGAALFNDSIAPGTASDREERADYALHLLGFTLENSRYTTATVKVDGLKHQQTFVDGAPSRPNMALEPGSHDVVIRYLASSDKEEKLRCRIETKEAGAVKVTNDDDKRLYTIHHVLEADRFSGLQLSPDGKYAIVSVSYTDKGGQSRSDTEVRELATGRVVDKGQGLRWMPSSNRYYYIERKGSGQTIYAVDPMTRKKQVVAEDLPTDAFFQIAPDESKLIVMQREEGPREDAGVYEIVQPEDRQPGWRSRTKLSLYDTHNEVLQPLVFGYHNIHVADITADGQYALLIKGESRLTQRPTTLNTLLRMNLSTLECDTLVEKDGFINGACFSPDGSQLLIWGSPECLGGIGMNVPRGMIPSMTDIQLYLLNIDTKEVKALTRNFNPCVVDAQWSQRDGMVYFTAEDEDYVRLFRLQPKTGRIEKMKTEEDLVNRFSLARNADVLMYYGQSASNSDRLYAVNTKSWKTSLVEDLSAKTLEGVKLGDCERWTFVSQRGDTIVCRYYLPPSFDASEKYPMIVNYYGGCSPTSRNFESRYPQHAYAALGYVVLIVEPSGATGFGQAFSARHVNTAGEGPAEDIIEATQRFVESHPYVNEKKIGCIGASYGGFMTQYLQTKTDIFAAAISHAGISDHTSYWGEGYWGYSYSEVSMANSYPWTHPDLYTKQSPLFNADKIHTPILFLHGDADTNVPVGESIQMFTALKLLGRETAFVAVKDQNHHITQYDKRLKWQNTIFAWFAKYLQDDDTWWNALYPEKQL